MTLGVVFLGFPLPKKEKQAAPSKQDGPPATHFEDPWARFQGTRTPRKKTTETEKRKKGGRKKTEKRKTKKKDKQNDRPRGCGYRGHGPVEGADVLGGAGLVVPLVGVLMWQNPPGGLS